MNTQTSEPQRSTQWDFLDALGDGVYGVDMSGLCIFINKAALRILGYDRPDELMGRNMHSKVHHTRPDGSEFPQAECPLLHTMTSGHPVRLEHEMLWRRDGTPFYAEYSSFPVLADGRITGSVITFNDGRVRQDAQRRLTVQHAVSQVLGGTVDADAIPEALLQAIGLGLQWDVGLFWRREPTERDHDTLVCRAVWRSRESAYGQEDLGRVLELGSGLPGSVWFLEKPIHIADISAALAGPRQAAAAAAGMRSGFAFPIKAGPSVIGAIEFYNHRKIEIDDSLLEAVSTLGQQIGQTLERRRVEAKVLESEARFRTIANAIPQLAWMTEPNGAISWYNQRWYDYTGKTPAEMVGWGWKAVHHPDHLERVEKNLRASFATGTPWEDSFPLRAADGTYRWFLSRALPIRENPDHHPDGRILGWFGTNTDITALREVEQTLEVARDEAEAANRAKSTFMANMSHELRTPLSAIIGYAEMLVEEIEDGATPADLVTDVSKIEGNARHLLGLINDVLDLSKVESGKMEAFAETFDVRVMLEDVAATVGGLLEKKGNRLTLQIADGLGRMHSDVTRIRQVLLNLLSNAAKFTTAGSVTLSADRDMATDRIRFSVTDTGIGMTEAQLAKLFQRFQQADASTTRQFGGTGLGLALSLAFVRLLGGEITVESTPGRGSTFVLSLPVTLPPAHIADAAAVSASVASVPVAVDRQVVLVVDDDATQRDLMSRFLEREGYVARTAADGPTGLAVARRLHPHAILLDVTMPGMDGWSVLSALKADPQVADIPVVMVTFATDRALASSLGAADYVVKPVNWDRLRQVMERFRDADGNVLVVEEEADARARPRPGRGVDRP